MSGGLVLERGVAETADSVWDDLRAEVESHGFVPAWGSKLVAEDFLRNGGSVTFTAEGADDSFVIDAFRIVDGPNILHRQAITPPVMVSVYRGLADSLTIDFMGLTVT